MSKPVTKYGVINEDEFSFHSPRCIDGDEYDTLAEAFEAAGRLIEEGVEEVSIVRCRYSAKHESWVELVGIGSIQIDARDAEWSHETDPDEAERS